MTTAVEPKGHTIEAQGLRFRYVEWGEPDAPPILLLHGISSMGRIWDPLARALLDRYRLIAVDQRGHGDTSWPSEADYSTDDYVADLEALTEAWGIDRFALIGLSMGGHNAMAFASRHPERITHLVPIDIRPGFDFERRPTRELEKYTADHGHASFEDHDAALRVMRLTNQTTPDDALSHRLSYLLKRLPDGRWTFKHDPRVSYHWRPADLWEEIQKISSPVLVVRGGKSQVFSERAAERMRGTFAKAELITIEQASHTVPEDTRDEFIDAVRGFLERYP